MVILRKVVSILTDTMADHCIVGHIYCALQIDILTIDILVLDVESKGNVFATDVTDGDIIGKGQLTTSDLLLNLI